jgi:LmbE family N-acetylglucosaminyl deacetylase
MKLTQPDADIFVPNGEWTPAEALARTTHLCVTAHQDDIEIMAYHGIAECFGRDDQWFGGVVVTNDAGSPRAGGYANYSDEEMQAVRRKEQREAAQVGEYSIRLQLAHPSSAVKATANQPADKHDTCIKSACTAGGSAMISRPQAGDWRKRRSTRRTRQIARKV